MNKKMWYFSFGVAHYPYNKNYVALYGTCDETRNKMFEYFGKRWAMQYDSIERLNPSEWGLTELNIETVEKKMENKAEEQIRKVEAAFYLITDTLGTNNIDPNVGLLSCKFVLTCEAKQKGVSKEEFMKKMSDVWDNTDGLDSVMKES